MKTDKISKEFILGCIITVAMSIFGGWQASTEHTFENTRRISIVEAECRNTDSKYQEIINSLNTLQQDVNTIKSDIKLLGATKADKKYTE